MDGAWFSGRWVGWRLVGSRPEILPQLGLEERWQIQSPHPPLPAELCLRDLGNCIFFLIN